MGIDIGQIDLSVVHGAGVMPWAGEGGAVCSMYLPLWLGASCVVGCACGGDVGIFEIVCLRIVHQSVGSSC